ncbi:MAG TPA: alpha amylase C-terminal domain-containing protein [Cellvibrio sp.]|nr:alpha amylase C-terminal domain-containing protein [Cellvibrio sp.]
MKKLITSLFSSVLLLTLSLSANAVPKTAFVHLFEWQWTDIASECENHLGPDGYSAVQISPPQKSINGGEWWTRYQPVSYSIEGRSGNREQFIDMVKRCKAVGVDIYADAVINHMAAWNRNFPEVPYGPNDFHNCTTGISYKNLWQVHNCDMDGLNDLKTESEYVRSKIIAYMNDLTSMGVAGFRIDAAKHMPPEDIANIVKRLNGTPYIYQEVIGAAGEEVQPSQYTHICTVTEFNFTNTLGHYFKGRGRLKDIKNIGTSSWSGWLASTNAQVFVANHDNQRKQTNDIITHKDGGNLNELAHVFMLGWAYGYPQVMSSYDWNSHNQGPPSSGASSCSNGWLCEHRIRAIRNMVAFRNNTISKFSNTNQWDNGNNQIAWGRGGLGYVVINREDGGTLNRTFATGMPAGTYCDIIHADFDYTAGTCSGASVTVDASGNASFSVNSRDAVAFHVGAKVGVPCPDCGGNSSTNGSSSSSASSTSSVNNDKWYFRGTPNNWSSTEMTLSDGLFCTTQQFGAASTNPRFKIDHHANWIESYPNADYVVSANASYRICFNASTHKISVDAITSSSSGSKSSSSIAYISSSRPDLSSSSRPTASSSSSLSYSSADIHSSESSIASSSVDSGNSNGEGPQGFLQLEMPNYRVVEGTDYIDLLVLRVDGSRGEATVDYEFFGGRAYPDQDYVSNSGTLTFNDGETSKTIRLYIINDTLFELAKNVNLGLGNARGASLGENTRAEIIIEDDDIESDQSSSSSSISSSSSSTGVTSSSSTAVAQSSSSSSSATAIATDPSPKPGSKGGGATSPLLLLIALCGLPYGRIRSRFKQMIRH